MDDELESLSRVSKKIALAVIKARDARWLAAVEKVRGRYPEYAFPPDGKSIDCNSARMARLVCDEVTRLATEGGKKEAT